LQRFPARLFHPHAELVIFEVAVRFDLHGSEIVVMPHVELRRWQLEVVGNPILNDGHRVQIAPVVPAVATVVGIGAAVLLNYLASERIFAGSGVADALNWVAHQVYNSRLRGLLMVSGLYPLLFGVYARVLAVVTGDEHRMTVGGVTATVGMATPTETVSVLHTLENERAVLEQFVADIEPDDRVLDVGANVGVYTALADAAGAAVVAVEPHTPTAERCRENCPGATVHELALGAGVGRVGLDVARDVVGTQRGSVGDGGAVRQVPGDRLPTPDVVKIDVEGAELAVLDGLQRTLAESPPRAVYVETHGDSQAAAVRERLEGDVMAFPVGEEETMLRVVC